MEQTEFTNLAEPWWLLQPEGIDNRIEQAREQLATNLGWDRLWYTNQPDVERLYNMLTPSHQTLFDKLDYLSDLEEQVRWLDELVADTKPAPATDTTANAANAATNTQVNVDAAVDQAISHLSSDASNELAQQLNVAPDEIAALADNAEFKEILRQVLENRMSSAGN